MLQRKKLVPFPNNFITKIKAYIIKVMIFNYFGLFVCFIISHCWPMLNKLLIVQYITKPAGKVANRNVNITGIHANILAWTGSGGVGFSLNCNHMVIPITIGQIPSWKKSGIGQFWTEYGKIPNRFKIEVGYFFI